MMHWCLTCSVEKRVDRVDRDGPLYPGFEHGEIGAPGDALTHRVGDRDAARREHLEDRRRLTFDPALATYLRTKSLLYSYGAICRVPWLTAS